MNALRVVGQRPVLALASALAVAVVTGVPTDLVDTPLFGREIPPTWWSYPVWAATAILSGILIASYAVDRAEDRRTARVGGVGGAVAYLAIGCPVCNKVVLLLLGTSGAITWFEPLQPLLAFAALGLLVTALRLRSRTVCRLPAGR